MSDECRENVVVCVLCAWKRETAREWNESTTGLESSRISRVYSNRRNRISARFGTNKSADRQTSTSKLKLKWRSIDRYRHANTACWSVDTTNRANLIEWSTTGEEIHSFHPPVSTATTTNIKMAGIPGMDNMLLAQLMKDMQVRYDTQLIGATHRSLYALSCTSFTSLCIHFHSLGIYSSSLWLSIFYTRLSIFYTLQQHILTIIYY